MIDHSLLKPELTEDEIIRGCEIAKKYDEATVCCAPSALSLVAKQLKGSGVKPTTVIGFPHGYNKTETKVFEAKQAIKDGALEIDMALNIGKLKSRDFDYVRQDIKAVVDIAHKSNVLVKVILENFYLTDKLKEIACKLCEEAGADWVILQPPPVAGLGEAELLRFFGAVAATTTAVAAFVADPDDVNTVVEPEGTPMWVWVVIALSAVLLVGVVVLIIRTRRPV
jgi:deoxyribose-phosphate aldolase